MRRLTIALVALVVCGCSTTRSYVSDPGPYDLLPATKLAQVGVARGRFESGDLAGACKLLGQLRADYPLHLGVATFLQDVELALLRAGGAPERLAAPAGPLDAEAARHLLAADYGARASEEPGPVHLVLAARLQDDADTALALLAQAIGHDPLNVWAYYARGWIFAVTRRFPEARESAEFALKLDSGHLPTMRLHASLLAGGGETNPAANVLELWLERTEENPLFDPRQRAEAQVDLAALRVLQGEPTEALDVLDAIEPSHVLDRARAELVRAAAYDATGRPALALRSAQRAAELAPERMLPLVQEALLVAPEDERAVWQRLLEKAQQQRELGVESPMAEATDSVDFQSLLLQLQAHTRLERLDETPDVPGRP